MRIGLSVGDLTGRFAAGRAVENLARGLAQAGHEVVVITEAVSHRNEKSLEQWGEVVFEKRLVKTRPLGRLMYRDYVAGKTGRALARLIRLSHVDTVLHASGFGWGVAEQCPNVKMVLWCQGLPYALPSSLPWLDSVPIGPLARATLRLLEPALDKRLRHQLSGFSLCLSNSKFVSEWLYFRTGLYSDCLYPSIDTDLYSPPHETHGSGDPYLLAVGNASEIDFDVLRELAGKARIVKVGAQCISGCENTGFVSEEKLIQLYQGATATLFPTTQEPFGYVPIESMACGTPVVAYCYQGPGETVVAGKTGWVVSSRGEFMRTALQAERVTSQEMRHACRLHVCATYSIGATAERAAAFLLGLRGRCADSPRRDSDEP